MGRDSFCCSFSESGLPFLAHSFPPVPCVRNRGRFPGGQGLGLGLLEKIMNRFHAKMYESCLGAERNIIWENMLGKNDTRLFWVELIFGGIRFQICPKWLHFQRSFCQCLFRNVGKVNKILTNIFSNRLPSLPSKQWLTLIYSYLWVGHNWSFISMPLGVGIYIYIYIMQLLWGSSMAIRSPTNRRALSRREWISPPWIC